MTENEVPEAATAETTISKTNLQVDPENQHQVLPLNDERVGKTWKRFLAIFIAIICCAPFAYFLVVLIRLFTGDLPL